MLEERGQPMTSAAHAWDAAAPRQTPRRRRVPPAESGVAPRGEAATFLGTLVSVTGCHCTPTRGSSRRVG